MFSVEAISGIARHGTAQHELTHALTFLGVWHYELWQGICIGV